MTRRWWTRAPVDRAAFKAWLAVASAGPGGAMARSTFTSSIVPSAIFCGWLPYGYYEGSLQPQERFTNTNLADAGFMQLAFKGAPVFPDSYVPDGASTGRMYFVNFDHVEFVVLSGADFTLGEFVRVENQSARVAQVETTAQLVATSRKYHNKMLSISA